MRPGVLARSAFRYNPAMPKPTVFIGSSTEQLATAHALAERLRAFANPTVWDNAEFELNESIFDGLLKAAQVTDYAVFVFDPDDVTRIRNVDSQTVRDNGCLSSACSSAGWVKGERSGSAHGQAKAITSRLISSESLICHSLGRRCISTSPSSAPSGKPPNGFEA